MAQFTRVKRRTEPVRPAGRVYADLDALVRLQFQARGFSFLPRQPVHSVLSGRHTSRLRGRGLNFEELRGYLPGDDIRTIDWKVTARTREPHVRVYTEERDRPVWLLVDQRQPMFFGSRGAMKSVLAAEAAALAAWRVLSSGDRVGGLVISDSSLDLYQPQRSQEAVMRLLSGIVRRNRALKAGAVPEYCDRQLNQALRRIGALSNHDELIVLITDGQGLDEESRRRITRLSEHNDVIALFVFDPMEREIAGAGHQTYSDGRRRVTVNAGDQALGRAFRQDFEDRLERMADTSRRYGIPVLPLDTSLPVAEQVRDLIGRHSSPSRP